MPFGLSGLSISFLVKFNLANETSNFPSLEKSYLNFCPIPLDFLFLADHFKKFLLTFSAFFSIYPFTSHYLSLPFFNIAYIKCT